MFGTYPGQVIELGRQLRQGGTQGLGKDIGDLLPGGAGGIQRTPLQPGAQQGIPVHRSGTKRGKAKVEIGQAHGRAG